MHCNLHEEDLESRGLIYVLVLADDKDRRVEIFTKRLVRISKRFSLTCFFLFNKHFFKKHEAQNTK